MNKLRTTACAAALLAGWWPARAQNKQGPNDIQLWEFRQVLVDLGSFVDARKGTNLQRTFGTLPDSVLEKWYPAIPNPRAFQGAVAALREHAASVARRQRPALEASAVPMAVTPNCTPNSIIDIAPGALCTPAYPDPNNVSWQNMVAGLIGVSAFSGGTGASYADVSPQGCDLNTEINLELVNVALQALDDVGAAACDTIPNTAVTLPFRDACFIDLSIAAIADQVNSALYTTCEKQDALVNSAEIDANFRNTVTIYNNLKGADSVLNNFFSSTDTQVGNITTDATNDFSSLTSHVQNVVNSFTAVNNQITTDYTSVDNHVTNINNQVNGEFNNFDLHLTNVNNHVASEFTSLDAHLVALINQLASQIGQGTALLGADAKQLMKLQLTPDGQKVINPAILTCTGTNCPNVLAACPAAGCSWNNVGPLP